MTSLSRTRIMIVDDHPPIIQALSAFLKTEPEFDVVAVAKTADEARLLSGKEEINLVIMDIRLRPGSGIDLTKELVSRFDDLAVLMYSGESNVELVRRAIDAGARGYLLKGADMETIKLGIRIVKAGGVYLDPELPERPKPRFRGETLTPAEERVMRLYGQWKTNEQVADELRLSPATVRTHRNNIMYKLDLSNTTELLREAIRRHGNLDDYEG